MIEMWTLLLRHMLMAHYMVCTASKLVFCLSLNCGDSLSYYRDTRSFHIHRTRLSFREQENTLNELKASCVAERKSGP